MSEGLLCVNLLKKILLMAGIKPVTFSLVCKRWRRVIRSLTLKEKWSYQLELARQANVYCADIFDFDMFNDASEIVEMTDKDIIYFVQKPTTIPLYGFKYNKNCLVRRDGGEIAFLFPGMRLYGGNKLFTSLRAYHDEGHAIVTGLRAFTGQYIWNGEVVCTEIHNTYCMIARNVLPHGQGDACVNGTWYYNVRAEFGCLYREGQAVVFPDMTQNLKLL